MSKKNFSKYWEVRNLEALLLCLAFRGSAAERRLMGSFFELFSFGELTQGDSLEEALFLLREVYRRLHLEEASLLAECARLEKRLLEREISFINLLDDRFPPLLRRISSCPFGLFYRGDIELMKQACVSVVGTRKPSSDSIRMCEQIAFSMKDREVCAVSGLAFGVDSLIHKSCLKHGVKTISVLPSCVDRPVPIHNAHIARSILDAGGLLLSENPPGYLVHKGSYVERNRIISGVSEKTLVLEAAIKSGSMSTAGFAIEQDRDLYAMPGSISNPSAGGCNLLISRGARPLLDAEELFSSYPKSKKSEERKELHSELLAYIRERGRVEVDELIRVLGIGEVELITRLSEYEIFGYIRRSLTYVEAL
ncbi:MAG: DNA-processing protein DprA [Bacillota bacterium]|nr:DNA-processing protein DprA [Bacillota bacterium]